MVVFISISNEVPPYVTGCLKNAPLWVLLNFSGHKHARRIVHISFWKAGSLCLSEVQKHFCTISGSQYISKTIWVIRLQNFRPMISDTATRDYRRMLLVTDTGWLPTLFMAGIILWFSVSDNISCSLFMHNFFSFEIFWSLGNILF